MQTQPSPRMTTLAVMRDRARPLLIFAPNAEDSQLKLQLSLLQEHASDIKERDLVPVALTYSGESATETHFAKAEADAARRRLHVSPGKFAVILLGKDGGEKLRSSQPLDMQKLITTIDAMPMRQDEMRSHAKQQH